MTGKRGPKPRPKKPRKPRVVDARIRTPKANGRPPHLVTPASRGLVTMLLLLKRTQYEIASAAGIDEKTLRKHYRAELDQGEARNSAALMRTALIRALGGEGENARWQDADPVMLKFLLDRVAGLRAQPQQHVVGTYDLGKLSDNQLATLDTILGGVAVLGSDQSGDGEAGD